MPAIPLHNSPTGSAARPCIAVTVRLDPELREELARLAFATGRPLSAVIREALQRHVASAAEEVSR